MNLELLEKIIIKAGFFVGKIISEQSRNMENLLVFSIFSQFLSSFYKRFNNIKINEFNAVSVLF